MPLHDDLQELVHRNSFLSRHYLARLYELNAFTTINSNYASLLFKSIARHQLIMTQAESKGK